jgi:cytochrome c-type biogenesis protein
LTDVERVLNSRFSITHAHDPKIPKEEITEEKLSTSIDGYLAKSRKETEHTAEIISENKQDNGYITNLDLPVAYFTRPFCRFFTL